MANSRDDKTSRAFQRNKNTSMRRTKAGTGNYQEVVEGEAAEDEHGTGRRAEKRKIYPLPIKEATAMKEEDQRHPRPNVKITEALGPGCGPGRTSS